MFGVCCWRSLLVCLGFVLFGLVVAVCLCGCLLVGLFVCFAFVLGLVLCSGVVWLCFVFLFSGLWFDFFLIFACLLVDFGWFGLASSLVCVCVWFAFSCCVLICFVVSCVL